MNLIGRILKITILLSVELFSASVKEGEEGGILATTT